MPDGGRIVPPWRTDQGVPVHAAVKNDAIGVGSAAIALRRRAAETVAGELKRLESRVPSTDEVVHLEAAQTVARVVEALLRAPLARLEQLEGAPGERASLSAMLTLLDIDVSRQGGR